MKKKVIVGFLVSALCISMVAIKSFAANECNLNMTVNKTSADRGDTIDVVVSMSDINIATGNQGVGAYKAHLDYDENRLQLSSIVVGNGWDEPVYSENTIICVREDGECISTNSTLVKFVFTVKEEASSGDVDITFGNLVVTDGVNEINVSASASKSITINEVKKPENTVDNTVTNTTNEVLNQNIVNMLNEVDNKVEDNVQNVEKPIVNNGDDSDKEQVENLANTKLPQTGSKLVIPVIALVAIIVCVAYFNYRKIKAMKKEEKQQVIKDENENSENKDSENKD